VCVLYDYWDVILWSLVNKYGGGLLPPSSGSKNTHLSKMKLKHIPQKHGCPVNFDKGSQMLSWAGLWAAYINIINAIPNLLSFCIIFYSLHTVCSLKMWLQDGHLSSKTSLFIHFHPKKVIMFSHHSKNLNLIFVLKALPPSYFISYKVCLENQIH